ncbi:MAG: cation transporter [Chlamydiae bacterium]|nr:cation transporter [Chlamydiota bacterium]
MTRRAWGYLEGSVSIVLNTALFAAKLWLGAACGSLAIVADAWHTLSDSLTSAVVILGFWVSGRPADDKHPFGHGRAELVAAIVIGTLLAVVAFFFLHESILKLRHPERYPAARFGTAAAALFLVSVVVKEAMARFSIWAGGKTASAALVADGWHHRSDAVASALILAGGLFGGRLGWIDGAMGAAVSLLIGYAAYDVLRSASSLSMGEAPAPDLERRVMEIVADAAPEVAHAHHLHAHAYGDHLELTLHLGFPPRMSIEEAHAISGRVKQALKRRLDVESTTHLEPLHSAGQNTVDTPRGRGV